MLFHEGKALSSIVLVGLLLTGCQEGNSTSAEPDTTHFTATANGLAAITLHNGSSGATTFNIPATGTPQYTIIANPGGQSFYTALLSGVSYCALSTNDNGGYTTSVSPGQNCDILLLAAHDNPPSQSTFTLNIGEQGSSASYPITVNLSNYLYVAGEFTSDSLGETTYNHLAKWNGSAWFPVTSQGVDNDVNVIAVDPLTGDLYAGGWFNHAGNLTVNGIAKFNRNGANALGTGFDNAVNAIVFNSDNTVVAGGNFSHYLAAFNDSSWRNLDPTAQLTGPVRALVYDDAGTLWVGGNFPKADTSFANGVGYPLYKDAGSGLTAALYADDRVDTLFNTSNDGLIVGGDFTQYATALNGTATSMAHVGKLHNGVFTQVGQNGNINRVVKSLVQVGNTLYLSGYFETAYPGVSPNPNPYGTVQIVAACSLTSNTCTNINTPINSWTAGTYWVYQVVADNQGQLYGVVRQDNTLDGGLGPDLVYTYTPAQGWQALNNTGFNYLAFSEALGSVINVSGK